MTYIQRLNSEVVDLDKIGIRTVDFIVNSPDYHHVMESVEGTDGLVDMGSAISHTYIFVTFRISAADWIDFGLQRNEIFKLLRSKRPFYLIEKRNPGKRWLVKVDSAFSIPQKGAMGRFDVPFIAYKGLSESTGTTLDPRTYETELWQYGQGLLLEDYSYVHNTRTFKIYNAGDEDVDPRQMPLKIKYQGASNNLKIANNTTGDVWQYNGSSTSSQTILLDGIRSLKNGSSIFRDTNKKLISLAPGWNDFTLSGTSGSFLISFDFRFYYF